MLPLRPLFGALGLTAIVIALLVGIGMRQGAFGSASGTGITTPAVADDTGTTVNDEQQPLLGLDAPVSVSVADDSTVAPSRRERDEKHDRKEASRRGADQPASARTSGGSERHSDGHHDHDDDDH